MARIRTIKPEFWDSPGTAKASHVGRLFFIAMWNWADDWGVGLATPKPLIGFAFPNDDAISTADFPTLAKEVAECFDVQFYEVAGRCYYSIPSWDIHQRTERKAKRLNPAPDEAESLTDTGKSERPTVAAELPTQGKEVQAWEREREREREREQGKGNRGTGEQSSPSAIESVFDAAYDHWPKKVERKAALDRFKAASKRLTPEVLAGHIIRFGDAYAATTDKRFTPALGVWLGHERWTDELPTAPKPERNRKPTPEERARQTLALATDIDMRGIEQ
jgi:hypothetical protein